MAVLAARLWRQRQPAPAADRWPATITTGYRAGRAREHGQRVPEDVSAAAPSAAERSRESGPNRGPAEADSNPARLSRQPQLSSMYEPRRILRLRHSCQKD